MKLKTMPLAKIKPYERNPRRNDAAVEAVAESIRQCGYIAPIVVDEDGVIYKDNRFKLHITQDGKTLFDRSFTKADFNFLLSKDFQKYGIMDGMRFNHTE